MPILLLREEKHVFPLATFPALERLQLPYIPPLTLIEGIPLGLITVFGKGFQPRCPAIRAIVVIAGQQLLAGTRQGDVRPSARRLSLEFRQWILQRRGDITGFEIKVQIMLLWRPRMCSCTWYARFSDAWGKVYTSDRYPRSMRS